MREATIDKIVYYLSDWVLISFFVVAYKLWRFLVPGHSIGFSTSNYIFQVWTLTMQLDLQLYFYDEGGSIVYKTMHIRIYLFQESVTE